MGHNFHTIENMVTLSEDTFWPMTKVIGICKDAKDVRAKTKISMLAVVIDAIGSSVKNLIELEYLNKLILIL